VAKMNQFKNLKIKSKIYSLAGLLIILSLVIIGLSELRSNAQNEVITANNIDNYMLQARRSEKDFFARKDMKYAQKVKAAYQNILKLTSESSENEEIKEIENAINNYYTNFQKSIQIENELGLDENSGLQGKLRDAVHTVEAIASKANKDNIMVPMLMARRHEKDFMLRGKEKYVKELHDAVNDIISSTRQSNLSANIKSQIFSLSNNYQKGFDDYAEKIRQKNTATENLRTAVHKIEPLVASLELTANSNASFWQKAGLTVVFIAILIGIILAYFITKLITDPIEALSKGAEAFGNGETNVTIDVKSEDETGLLGKAMNKMIEQIELQISYLDNLPTPVIIIDKEYNIQYMNEFGCKLVGKSKEDCVSSKCYNLMHADHCNTDQCRLHQAMNDRQEHGSEQVARPNGKELDIMYTGTPIIDKNGELLGAMEFVADISNVKEAEKYLDRSTDTIMKAMEKVAEGDLTVSAVPEKTDDNIAKLFEAFNKTVQNLKTMTNHIKDAVAATASASTQISSSAEEMAAGAQEQSSQTGEVATAMEEMTSTIVETNKNTNLAAVNSKRKLTIIPTKTDQTI